MSEYPNMREYPKFNSKIADVLQKKIDNYLDTTDKNYQVEANIVNNGCKAGMYIQFSIVTFSDDDRNLNSGFPTSSYGKLYKDLKEAYKTFKGAQLQDPRYDSRTRRRLQQDDPKTIQEYFNFFLPDKDDALNQVADLMMEQFVTTCIPDLEQKLSQENIEELETEDDLPFDQEEYDFD